VDVTRNAPASAKRSARFVRIEACVAAGSEAERTAAEAFDAGASGIEERPGAAAGDALLLIYAPSAAADAIVRRLEEALGAAVRIGAPEAEPEVDWSTAWREGIEAVEVSPRLRLRPPFLPAAPRAGQREIVIEPGQAFGTGGHASTRLALELVDALASGLPAGARVLDVGTGSGVLALAALALGATRAVAFDLDPLAAPAARDNARANGLGAGLVVFTGPLDALAGGGFDAVLANLLRSELVPILPGLAGKVEPGGAMVLAGLLASDVPEVVSRLEAQGFGVEARRCLEDADGEVWVGLLMRRRAGADASRRADA